MGVAATGVLFVCLGNICRSPMAEGIFRRMTQRAGLADTFRVDSAGTGDWHLGEPPDRRAVETAARHGIDIAGQRARLVTRGDFGTFAHILAMDHANLAALQRMAPAGGTRPRLLLDYAAGISVRDVPDPYRVGGFDEVFRLIEAGAAGLLRALRNDAADAQ